jgi:hypothetical protein
MISGEAGSNTTIDFDILIQITINHSILSASFFLSALLAHSCLTVVYYFSAFFAGAALEAVAFLP